MNKERRQQKITETLHNKKPINFATNPAVDCSAKGIEIKFHGDVETTINTSTNKAYLTSGDFATAYVRVGDKTLKYNALQMHIHTPSEHTVTVNG